MYSEINKQVWWPALASNWTKLTSGTAPGEYVAEKASALLHPAGMAINFPEGTASYSFKSPQQYAMHLRLTPEVKEALLKSQQNGKTASLRLTGTGLDNVGHVIADSHAQSGSLSPSTTSNCRLSLLDVKVSSYIHLQLRSDLMCLRNPDRAACKLVRYTRRLSSRYCPTTKYCAVDYHIWSCFI